MRRLLRPALLVLLVAAIAWTAHTFELTRYLARDEMKALV